MWAEDLVLDIKSLNKLRYHERKPQVDSDRVFIFLHGYTESAEVMERRFFKLFPKEAHLVSLCGPYPLPKKLEDGSYQMGYSWFFFNSALKKYFVHYDVCTDYLLQTVEALGLVNKKLTLIGFSQGGYCTVNIAKELKQVDHIIGLGCQFVIDEPKWGQKLLVEALHGEDDSMVELPRAKSLFSKIPKENQGRFEIFKSVGHGPSQDMLKQATSWALAGPQHG